MGGEWPLIGRSEELGSIDTLLRRRGVRGVVLAGVAGVGKTRLAREAAAGARRGGMVCRWVAGSVSARTVPLGAFASVLPSVGSNPLRALGQAAQALLSDAGGTGVLVVVDDAHLLDEMSATLVHQLVTSTAAVVVITVRTGEPAPDAVTAVWKDGHLDRLELMPLSHVETGALLEAALGGPVQSGAVTRMWRLSRGNPLYLRELVLGGRSAGWLEERDGLWRLAGRLALPASLVELVESRMGGLSEPVAEVLDLLAIAGELGEEVLGGLTDPATLEVAETSGLITVDAEMLRSGAESFAMRAMAGERLWVALAHPLYGEVCRARIGVLRARRIRGRIVRALMAAGLDGVDDELRCAALMADSDLPAEPELLVRAAGRSAQLLDMSLAVRLARAAVASGGGFEPQAIIGQALSIQGHGAQADQELRALAGLAANDAQRAWAAAVRAGNLFFTLNRSAEAEAVLGDALAAIEDERAREILWALHSVFEGLLGRPAGAMRAAGVVLDADSPQQTEVFLASWGLALALSTTGAADSLEPVASRGYGAGVTFDTAVLRFNLAEAEILALRLAGYVTRAEKVAARCRLEAAEVSGVPHLMAIALAGHVELARCRLREATRWLREALIGFTAADPGGRVFDCLLWLTQALAMTGDAVAAERTLDDLIEKRQTGFGFREPDVVLARAWVAAAQGAVDRAVALAHEAAGIAVLAGMSGYEVLAWQTAVRFGDRGVAARLAELALLVDGPRAPLAARHAAALAAGDGHALRGVSVELERMGDLGAAADAAAQAAIAHAHADCPHQARLDASRAHRLARRCQGARTPAIVAVAQPPAITAREREIITLTGLGLSNRDIAQRLGVSVRTVEGHLYRAFAKLGVSRRADLALLPDE